MFVKVIGHGMRARFLVNYTVYLYLLLETKHNYNQQ